jgi:L-lactate permease
MIQNTTCCQKFNLIYVAVISFLALIFTPIEHFHTFGFILSFGALIFVLAKIAIMVHFLNKR